MKILHYFIIVLLFTVVVDSTSTAYAQNYTPILYGITSQTPPDTNEELYKKLTTAKDILFHTATNQTLPIFMCDVDETTLTLVVGIDDTKATLTADEYQKMIKNIVGNIPVKIVYGHNAPLGYDISGLSLSPLQQFKSGIKAENVKCSDGFTLVLKSEDGSPACVKPDTAKILYKRGWGLLKNKIGTDTSLNQNMFSSTNCTGTEIPKHQNGSLVVLLMSPNSTATVCTTYQFDYNWDSYPNKNIYEMGIVHFGLNLGPKFNVTTTPSSLNIINASEGATFSVLYTISSSLNSKGIYDSIPWGSCEQYPLAVGYTASELKKSDFPLEMLLDRPCYNVIFHAASNKIISGMYYVEVIVNGQ